MGAGLCFGFDEKDGEIPSVIFTNEFVHTKHFPKDGGVLFDPIDKDILGMGEMSLKNKSPFRLSDKDTK